MAGSKRRLLTPEQEMWVAARYSDHTNAELVMMLESELGVTLTTKQLCVWARRQGIRKSKETMTKTRSHAYVYTDEMCDFLREYVPGRTYPDVNDEFERRFGWRMSLSQYKNIKTKLGIKCGVPGGRFERGHIPANKGKSWDEQGLSPEMQAKMRLNTFRKGNVPHNTYHNLLDTRTDPDGSVWIYVKPRNAKFPAQHWISYARFCWMQYHGREFPDNCRCVHANHNKNDCSRENLVAVPNDVYGMVIGRTHGHAIEFWDRASLELAIAHARLSMKRMEIERKRPRRCEVCGAIFVPTGKRVKYGERVRTCDECRRQGKRAPMRRKEST